MKDFLHKHKERVVLGGMVVAFVLFVGGGLYLQKKQQGVATTPVAEVAKIRELDASAGQQLASGAGSAKMAAFFLKPSAGELLAKLALMGNLNQNVVEEKFLHLRVLWQAYFFSFRETEGGRVTLQLDVSEDGFGVEIESDVDWSAYPQLDSLKIGSPLWIGGEIQAVDTAGTGTVYLKAEHLSFGAEPPLSYPRPSAEKQ